MCKTMLIDNVALYSAILAEKGGKMDYRKLQELAGADKVIMFASILGGTQTESQQRFFEYLRSLQWEVREFKAVQRAHPGVQKCASDVMWHSARFSVDLVYEMSKDPCSSVLVTDDPAVLEFMIRDKRGDKRQRLMFFGNHLPTCAIPFLASRDLEFVDLNRFKSQLFRNTQQEAG